MPRRIAALDSQQVRNWVGRMAEQSDAGREAVGEFYSAVYPRLTAALRRRGVSADLAHDLATDLILRFVKSAGTFDPARPLLPYLLGAVNNANNSRLRRERKARRLTPADHDELAAAGPDPFTLVARAESAARLRAALAALPKKLAGAVVGDESRAVTAARLRVTPRKLDTLRRDAVRTLRAAVRPAR